MPQCEIQENGIRCIYPANHRPDHLFPEPGSGDLSDQIRLKVLLDRIAILEEKMTQAEARGYNAGIEAAAKCVTERGYQVKGSIDPTRTAAVIRALKE